MIVTLHVTLVCITLQAYNKHADCDITNTKFRSLYDIQLHTSVGTIQLRTVQL